MPTVLLEFPSRSAYVGVARLAVAGVARAAGFDEDSVFDIKTAVSEALSNAVLHGDETGEDTSMTVSWEDGPDSVIIEVRHPGDLDPLPGGGPDEQQALSMALLRSLVDETEFVSGEDGSTTIRLTLRH